MADFQIETDFEEMFYEEGDGNAINTEQVAEVAVVADQTDEEAVCEADNSETLRFVEQHRNVNTAKKTKIDVKKFREWIGTKGESRDLATIPPSTLDKLLAQFILHAKKNEFNERKIT